MRVMVVPIVAGALETILKGLEKGLEKLKRRMEELEMRGRIKTTWAKALLRLARIHGRILEICCHSDSSERPPANTGMKNLQGVKRWW